MFEVLETYFKQRIDLADEHAAFMRSIFIPTHLNKGEFLLREGEVPKYGAFVESGCLRSYVVDDKGKEHIVQFAPETGGLQITPA